MSLKDQATTGRKPTRLTRTEASLITSHIPDFNKCLTAEDLNLISSELVKAGFVKRKHKNLKVIAEKIRLKVKRKIKAKESKIKRAKENPIKFRASVLISGSKERTKQRSERENRNIPHELTVDDIYNKMQDGICEATGLYLTIKEYTPGDIGGKVDPRAASIDRIDSSGYYEKDNIQIVCLAYNKAKSECTEEETAQFALATVVGYYKKYGELPQIPDEWAPEEWMPEDFPIKIATTS